MSWIEPANYSDSAVFPSRPVMKIEIGVGIRNKEKSEGEITNMMVKGGE